jgi:K(+)-stimulated pyrophosphate-energized sodium pump
MQLPVFLTGQPEFYFLIIALAVAGAGFVYALLLIFQIRKEPQGTDAMQKVNRAIQSGALAYLNRQFRVIAIPIVLITIALYFTETTLGFPYAIGRSLAFLTGAVFSATVGYVGMRMAVQGNVRVAEAAKKGHGGALRIAYRTGTITGMLTDSFGLLGGTTIFALYPNRPFEVLVGFGLGGSLIALFMRVGGGIYTKSADVGADLVGKVEKGIPEDDPRNAAVIADLVGDNVGDDAGMAADIFESYEVTIVAAMILGFFVFPQGDPLHLPAIIFPIMVRSVGVFSSIIGTYAVRIGGGVKSALRAIFRGFSISAIISVVGFLIIATQYVGGINYWMGLKWFAATFAGIVLAVVINYVTEHFTSTDKTPVKEIAKSSQTGSATVILSGIASGYESTVWALVAIAGALFASVLIFGSEVFTNPSLAFYGVSLCGIGMLTLTGNNVSMDAFGPISDNANGIGEMAGLDKNARQVLADLDAVGNTTKAITKGIAIGSAAVAALALFAGFFNDISGFIKDNYSTLTPAQFNQTQTQWQGLIINPATKVVQGINVTNPYVFVGLLIGGAIPFMFSSLTVRAVERGASRIVLEVRRQFAEIPGLWEGKTEPDYARCVSICTSAAQRELLGLGILAIFSPILIAFLLNVGALNGFLAGLVLVGQLLAVYMSNAGAAWDNAKKTIEDGLFGGKGSDSHKATVIGDTVGDPLKDTAGPALNPMIKVSNLVAVLLGPLVLQLGSVFPANSNELGPLAVIILSVIALGTAIWYSKRSGPELQPPGKESKQP